MKLKGFDRPSLIGVIHAPPLPGSPRYQGDWNNVCDRVFRDADAYRRGGVDGLILENYGDVPFFPAEVSVETIAHLTVLASRLKQINNLPLGINILRNDGAAALAIALACGAQFIRVNVLCGARLTDQGIVHGIAHDLLRMRRNLGAQHIQIFADVDVKHSVALAPRDLAEEVQETFDRGGADAVIVTGRGSGFAVDTEHLKLAVGAAQEKPVLIGSGVSPENIGQLAQSAAGFIVGTALKRDARIENEVDVERVAQMRRALDDALRSTAANDQKS